MKIVSYFLLAFICQLESGKVKTPLEMKNYLLVEDAYMFTKYQRTEWESCTAYGQVMGDHKNITGTLWSLLSPARTHMIMITTKVKGTPAENCIKGWNNDLKSLATKENTAYVECLTPVSSEHMRLLDSLSQDISSYNNSKERAISGIDHCIKTYNSKEQFGERRNCARTYFDEFHDKAKILAEKYKQSKCFKRFEDTLLSCIDLSVKNIAGGTAQLLERFGQCDSVITNHSNTYNPLSAVNYKSKLHNAIKKGMRRYDNMNTKLEKQIEQLFELEATVSKRSLLKPLGTEYFEHTLRNMLRHHYEKTKTSKTTNCGIIARRKFDNIIQKGSKDYDTCDKRMVEDIKHNMDRLKKMFSEITSGMPDVGSAVMMSCASMLGFWKPDLVLKCYTLTLRGFGLRWAERHEGIAAITKKISRKELVYLNHTAIPLPCGIMKLNEIKLNTELALFEYNSCVHKLTFSN